MKKQISTFLAVTLLTVSPVSFVFAAPGAYTQDSMVSKQPDIVDTAVSSGSFSTLVTALKAADLVGTLKGSGPFTVFAPTDEAFAKLPDGTLADLLRPQNKDKLTAILTYHVVPGQVMAGDVVKLQSAETVNGKSVSISASASGVRINTSHVVKTDIMTSNGVIHVIDEVLIP